MGIFLLMPYFCPIKFLKMKKLALLVFVLLFTMVNCQNKKEKSTNSDYKSTASQPQSKIEVGRKLFAKNTCNTCHFKDEENIGPSIKKIVKIYDGQEKSIVHFLQGKSEPIVDTDEAQVAVMQANIDGFVKKLSLEELEAIVAYMEDVAK